MSDTPVQPVGDEAPVYKSDTKPPTIGQPVTFNDAGFQMSPTIGKLALALSKAQGTMKAAEKNRKNTHLGATYADLESMIESCRGPLAANELALLQPPATVSNGAVAVRTILSHSSGEWVSATLAITAAQVGNEKSTGVHRMGSAITYARRYGLGLVGVVSSDEIDDDDGNQAGKSQPTGRRETATAPANETARAKAFRLVRAWSGLPMEDVGSAVMQIVAAKKLPPAVNGKLPDATLAAVCVFAQDQIDGGVDFVDWSDSLKK